VAGGEGFCVRFDAIVDEFAMATTITKAFSDFAGRVMLTPKQRVAIKQRRKAIVGYLRNDGWIVKNAIFGGSHARGSKVRPVAGQRGDVDIYVVLDKEHKSGYGLFGDPPKQLLSDIKASLDEHLKTPEVRADSPAVRITYTDGYMDVVPAFRRLLGGFDIPYYNDCMIATPVTQGEYFSRVN
jgi:hypothetical protein